MRIKQIGNITKPRKNFDNPNDGRVYCPSGISPSITTCGGGNREPMIVDEKIIVSSRGRNPDNPSDRTAGANMEQRLEPTKEGLCGTITSVQKDNMVLERIAIKQATKEGTIEVAAGGVADLSYPTSKTRRGRVQDGGNVCPTIMAENQELCRVESVMRIRKLTPRECWLLQDYSEEDFVKAQSVNSNTQLYKQAGNGITKAVLMAIFTNLNIHPTGEGER